MMAIIESQPIATTPSMRPLHHDQHEIRARLLNRLGVAKNDLDQTKRPVVCQISGPSKRRRCSEVSSIADEGLRATLRSLHNVHGQSVRTVEYTKPLAYSVQDDDVSARVKKRIQWQATVAIKEIPSHSDYTEDARKKIWAGLQEIQENARRNYLEFFADGAVLEKVTEELDMMKWEGELVHPVTYWRLQDEKQRTMTMQGEADDPALVGEESEVILGLFHDHSPEPADLLPRNCHKLKNVGGSPLRRVPRLSSFATLSDEEE
jgi:hypothetical protein